MPRPDLSCALITMKLKLTYVITGYSMCPESDSMSQARLISVRSPANAISSMSMNGQEPPSCSLAGIITSRTKKISGEAPDASALMDFLNASGANLNDSDSDGLSNMLEHISGTGSRGIR